MTAVPIESSLEDFHFPSSPPGKIGWPWNQPDQMMRQESIADSDDWPRITIVTPNYNYGDFLEETIRSVLLQGYPNLEYIILDGGSTDQSIDIIKKYEPWITYWMSSPDDGQASAINKGLEITTGVWFNWLNSDDILMPNALCSLAKISLLIPTAQWISGGRIDLTANGDYADISIPWRTDPSGIALGTIFLPQDATFIRTSFLKEKKLSLSENCKVVFDTVLYYELLRHEKPLLTSIIFSGMRYHDTNKTTHSGKLRDEFNQKIMPYIMDYSFFRRGIYRLLQTRFHRFIYVLLLYLTSKGWISYGQDWKAVILDRRTGDFKQVSAHQVLFGLGTLINLS